LPLPYLAGDWQLGSQNQCRILGPTGKSVVTANWQRLRKPFIGSYTNYIRVNELSPKSLQFFTIFL